MTGNVEKTDIFYQLKSARLFSQFDDDLLIKLIENSSLETYQSGEFIIKEGETNRHFFVLMSGCVAVHSKGEFISKMQRKGDIIGEMSIIARNPSAYSTVADCEVRLFSVPAEEIFESGDSEMQAIVHKVFLDILTDKLVLTTNRVKGFQATSEELRIKQKQLEISEGNLLEKEIILQSILESMSDGVLVFSREGILLHINQAFHQMVGNLPIPQRIEEWPLALGLFKKDQKTPLTLDDLHPIEETPGRGIEAKEIYVKNDALPEGIWLRARGRQLQIEGEENQKGTVVVFHDYTNKKLEEQALIKAKEAAESLVKTKSDFLAVMSHELRTPLNTIMGMTEFLEGSSLTEEQKECLNAIRASNEVLYTRVKNILDYNEIESGSLAVKSMPFSIRNIMEEIYERYLTNAKEKGLQFTSEISSEIPDRISGYEKGVVLILRNLVDNAFKFTKKGTVNISAACHRKNDNTFLCLEVEDSGIGISKEKIQKLYQPFTQENSTYSRGYDGTGIGLSISYRICELMKGEFTVDSVPGKGTKFQINIPINVIDDCNLSDIPKEMTPPKLKTIDLNAEFAENYPLRILVAEDNPMNQKLIQKVLQKLGYQPDIAGDGKQAVDAVKNNDYDIVLMDLQMPNVDGIEATATIVNELDAAKQPSIIALTANVSDDVMEECFRVGMKDFMSKPLKIDKLAEMLKKFA